MKKRKLIDNIIGERIKARRLLLSMSQEALANHLDLSAQQVHKYEHGTSAISAARLSDVARVLQCPVNYFFEQFGLRSELPAELLRTLAAPRNVQALHQFSSLSTTHQLAMLDLMSMLNKEDIEDADDESGEVVPFSKKEI